MVRANNWSTRTDVILLLYVNQLILQKLGPPANASFGHTFGPQSQPLGIQKLLFLLYFSAAFQEALRKADPNNKNLIRSFQFPERCFHIVAGFPIS